MDIKAFAEALGTGIGSLSGLFSEYCNEMKESIADAKALMKEQNWQKLQRVIHNIKGVSANLELQEMFKAAEKIDLELKRDQTDMVPEDFQFLEETYYETEDEIREAFKAYDIIL